eukprot:9215530-Alexandrium_andersonii.AAC.1
MSASLVGSEMCIRDRPPAAGSGSWRVHALRYLYCPLTYDFNTYAEAHNCLLYTSDAADDM